MISFNGQVEDMARTEFGNFSSCKQWCGIYRYSK